MLTAEKSDLVEWRCLDVEGSEFRKCACGFVQRGVEGGVGKRLRQKQEDAFCATPLGEVVVHDGN
jgi:hypothetical protein